MLAALDPTLNPWRFQPHPQVWLLIAALVGSYVYALKVIGPDAVRPGQRIVTRRQLMAFVGAMVLLWFASDWPMHDISEEYLYSAHMLQHMVLAYFVPPLALIATPEWLMRAIVGDGRVYRIYRWFAHPVAAGLIFNVVVMVSHIPGVVNRSAENSPIHYLVHVIVVTSALLMWTPVCGPLKEFRISVGGQMIYLFFRRFAARFAEENTYRRSAQVPTSEIVGNDEVALTYAEVQEAFERSDPAPEPQPN